MWNEWSQKADRFTKNGPNLRQGQQPLITPHKQAEVVSLDFCVDVFLKLWWFSIHGINKVEA